MARLDASELGFDRAGKKASVDAAYSRYAASGSERDRLVWLIELEELDRLDYIIGEYAVKAPYDCIVIQFPERAPGEFISKGEVFAQIARPDEIYVYTSDGAENFSTGTAVEIAMGNFSYAARVVSCPSSAPSYSAVTREKMTVIKPDAGELERIFEDTPGALSAGWATVYVTTADKRGVLVVPEAAVIRNNNDSYCLLSQNGGRLRVPVEAGVSLNGYTVILSGLSEGDVVFL
jgi:multidrug efflux pump subunit AcrA (membrane-fusion protein)